MSFSIDTNILVYASDQDSPFQTAAARFLDTAVQETDVFFLAWPVIFGYLRIVTHPSILGNPLTPRDAELNIERLLSFPSVRVLLGNEEVWRTYRRISSELIVRGDFVSDAYLAALLRHHGVTVLYTNDSDFRKFPFLEVRNPFR
ncbi:MAG: VapC toxin family PIN domain ribonuclease [Acidobacteria bacterium]|nr:MAG: VapC toxin family PIN domain ribonuclease [Acidobacteriota bacterium]